MSYFNYRLPARRLELDSFSGRLLRRRCSQRHRAAFRIQQLVTFKTHLLLEAPAGLRNKSEEHRLSDIATIKLQLLLEIELNSSTATENDVQFCSRYSTVSVFIFRIATISNFIF